MRTRNSPADVKAAGGVLWRLRKGKVEIALVHRPRYDDWSLPKGKLRGGETPLAAAVREVAEETGARVAVSRFVGNVRYDVGATHKQTSYWAMRHLGGDFEPNHEVDEIV